MGLLRLIEPQKKKGRAPQKDIHAQSFKKQKTEEFRKANGEKKRLDFSLGVCGKDAGRGSEGAGSIFSSPRMFSFRRTFRVQQQSAGMLLQTAFMWKSLRIQPRPPSSPLLSNCFVNLPCAFTHARTEEQTNNPLPI